MAIIKGSFTLQLSYFFVLCFYGAIQTQLAQANANDASVPVLLWSPEKRMSELDSTGQSTIGAEEFHSTYLKPLMKDALTTSVVFLQDKLHADDFTQFADVYNIDSEGGAFSNIKSLMEENFSLELPKVSQPAQSLGQLQSGYQEDSTHRVSSLQELEGLDLKPSKPFLLIVKLPRTSGEFDREAALKKSDDLIGKVCKHMLKKSINYVAAYTGQALNLPSVPGHKEEAHSSRRLMATTVNTNGTLMNITSGNGTESLLFMRDIFICVKNVGNSACLANFTIVPTEDSANTSVVVNKTAMIRLSFSNETYEGAAYNITIITVAVEQGDRWVIDRVSLYVDPADASKNATQIINGTLSPGEMDFVVPILYSYHCTAMKMDLSYLESNFSSFKGTYVTFAGYQFQPFRVEKHRFFTSVDCVGFFTTAIWMGLFPTAILLIILLYGTLMLLNLSIMDRYDDPKGKTITVNTGPSQE